MTNKKLGLIALILAFLFGGVGMIAYQTNAKQNVSLTQSASVEKEEVNNNDSGANNVDNGKENDLNEKEENDETDEPIVGSASISESKAVEIAEKTYTGNGKLTQTELEMEDGVLVYAIEFTESDGNEVDVKINAKTGSVVKIESDKTEVEDED